MRVPTIDITIDEIVLHGLEPGQQHDFASAFDVMLTSLVRESAAGALGWRPRIESSRRMRSVGVSSAAGSSLGEAAAAKVFDVLSSGGRT